MRAEFLLRFAPAGPGLAVAVVYAGTRHDAYGWYTGARERTFPSAFFALRDDQACADRSIVAHSMGEDLHGAWLRHEPARVARRVHSPLPDAAAQELERLHAIFVADWLFMPGGDDSRYDATTYRRLGLPLHAVNVRPDQFDRFVRDAPVWVARSAGFDRRVLQCLAPYWGLDDPGLAVAA